MLVTAAVVLSLTTSYAIKYSREGVGAGLAYFGLAYVGFGLALLAWSEKSQQPSLRLNMNLGEMKNEQGWTQGACRTLLFRTPTRIF